MIGVGEGDGVDRYSIGIKLFESLEISRGDEVSGAVLFEIKADDSLYRATKKALSYLSVSDVSERGLVMKLRRAGFSREVAESVAADMQGHGYINEKRQLERLILREANEKLRGKRVIVPRLIAKGYSQRAVNEVLDELILRGEVSFSENAKRLCDKLLPDKTSEDEVKKLLYKYGYGALEFYA